MAVHRLRKLTPHFVRTWLLLTAGVGFVGACGKDESKKKDTGNGTGGEHAGESGAAGAGATGGSRGGTAGSAGDSGSGSGGEGDSGGTTTGGTGTGGRSGSGGSATGGAAGSVTGGTATGGTSDGGVGGEGGSGGAGDECESNDPIVLANAAKAWGLAVHDGHVYFTTHDLDGIVARMTTGGTGLQLIATGQSYPHQVAASGNLAFWVALGEEPGHLFQSSVTGAGRREIATGELNGIFSLNADDSRVYFTTQINRVVSVPFGGGSSSDISGGPFDSFIVDLVLQGRKLFWTNTGVSIFAPPQAGTAVIMSADPTGSTVSQLVTRLDYPQFQITANDESVYWSDETAIYRTARIGGTFSPIASLPSAPADVSPIVDMISNDEFVFYTDGKTLYRVPGTGGTREVVSDGWERITQLGIDETNVFFTDSLRGAVVKVKQCANATQASHRATAANDAPAPVADSWTVAPTTCPPDTNPHGCPEPTVVAPLPGAWGLAVDDENVYASGFGAAGSVVRVPLAGGNAVPIATNRNNPHDLTIDDENVYFCLHFFNSRGELQKVPKAGGVSELLAEGSFGSGVGRPVSDGAYVYYVTAFNGLARVAVTGGTATSIASGPYGSNAMDLAEDDGEIFWVNDGIWTDNTFTRKIPGSAYIGRSFVSGSPNLGRVDLSSGLDYPAYRLTIDATNVYFIDDTTLYRTSRTGGPTVELASIAPASGVIVDLHTDGQHLYFADLHAVYRVAVSGGPVETLTYGWADLRSIALDATHLYFTDFGSGAVLKRPK